MLDKADEHLAINMLVRLMCTAAQCLALKARCVEVEKTVHGMLHGKRKRAAATAPSSST